MLKIDQEFKSLIPPLTAEEYAQLEKNVIAEGCRDALVIWQGTIIDGHNRYEICQKHSISYEIVEKDFDSREKAKEWIILNQFGRRNLSAYDRSILALKLEDLFMEKAKANISFAVTQSNKQRAENPTCQKSDNMKIEKIDTKKELAKIAGVSHDTIHKVKTIEQKAPEEVKQKAKTGSISINQAYQTVRRLEKVKAVEEKFTPKGTETKSIDIYNTDNKYNIIYADPPWKYWEGGQKNQSLHYKTMTIKDICELPVKNIADTDCILFLWVTYPVLQECFKVIEAWGFEYSTAGFVWVKKNKIADTPFFGNGSWTRANSELCLIATKGSVLRLDASISQIIESPIEEHSKKPAVTRELITKLVGELPRIELFSRQTADGWDCWGNEV